MMTSPVFQLTPGYYTVTWSPFSYMPASLFLNRSFKDGAGFFFMSSKVIKTRSFVHTFTNNKIVGLFVSFFFFKWVTLDSNILKKAVW